MGLIIIFIILTFICVGLFVLGVCLENEYIACPSIVLGVVLFFITLGFSLDGAFTQAFIEQGYEEMLLRKQVIEYRMQHEDIITPQDSEDSLYTQIRDFNQEILNTRTFKDNWLVGVFYNYKIATIDYIDLED